MTFTRMRITTLSMVGLFMVLLSGQGALQAADASPHQAITGVTILMGDKVIADGVILFKEGTILAVGKNVKLPKGTRTTSEKGKVLMAGLVAADSLLSAGPGADPHSINTQLVAVDGFDYFSSFQAQLAGGTTCAYLSPGDNRLVPGLGSVVKLGALPEKAIVKKVAALDSVLTPKALNPPPLYSPKPYPLPSELFPHQEGQLPSTPASQAAEFRRFLAQDNPTNTALKDNKLTLRIRADSVAEIKTALTIARENRLSPVIVGGREAGQVAPEIRRAKGTVVWRCPFNFNRVDTRDPQAPVEKPHLYAYTPALLEKAGVPVVICGATDSAQDLLSAVSFAVAHGFPREKALAAVTSQAASVLGVSDKVGSLDKGKHADFILLDGMPLAEGTAILKTYVNGRMVYEHQGLKKQAQAGDTLLKNALVLTGDGGHYPATDILIDKGIIVAVGHDLKGPARAKSIDLTGKVVIPGLIDLASRLGTHYFGADNETNVPPFNGGSTFLLSPGEIIRPDDPCFKASLEEGVMGILVRGGEGSVVAGTGALLMAGAVRDDFLVKPFACIDVDLSGSSWLSRLNQFKSLMGRLDAYEKAGKQYRDALEDYTHRKPRDTLNRMKEPAPPGVNPQYELLIKARKREIPLFVRVNRGDEIAGVVKFLAGETGFACNLVEAEGMLRAPHVAHLINGVILTPPFQRRIEGKMVDLPKLLEKKGIPFAIASDGALGSLYLRYYAAEAVRRGLSPDLALRALTSVPARMLGVSDQFGVIAKSRQANLVVLDGPVFTPGSRVQMVLLKGNVVYKRSGQ